jgi:hypothetical protein
MKVLELIGYNANLELYHVFLIGNGQPTTFMDAMIAATSDRNGNRFNTVHQSDIDDYAEFKDFVASCYRGYSAEQLDNIMAHLKQAEYTSLGVRVGFLDDADLDVFVSEFMPSASSAKQLH